MSIFAQKTELVVQDKFTQKPIENVYFFCGTNSGYSTENGKIFVDLSKSNVLKVSHLTYGVQYFSGSSLEMIKSKGLIEIEPQSFETLNPISVYALKERKPKESIRLQTADWVHHDAGSVLQQITGFDAIKKSGSFGFDPTFRGFKLDQLNILNDGTMSAAAACPNRMDPPTSQIPINMIQEIEITKGPHSFRYGPSMGAVVNFRMLDPDFFASSTGFGRFTTGYESNGDVLRTEGQLGIRKSRIQLSANGSFSKGGNYTSGNDTEIPSNFKRGTVGIMSDIKTANNQIFSLSVNRNFARDTDFPVLMMDLLSDDTWMSQAKYKIVRNNAWFSEWTSQISAGIVNHTMGNILRNPSNMIAKTDAHTQTINARTEFLIHQAKLKMYVGADTKSEFISGDRTREMLMGPMKGKILTDFIWQDSKINRTGVFSDAYYQLNSKNTLALAARIDNVNSIAKQPAESFLKNYTDLEKTEINTSASIGISTKWNDALRTGIWFGRGLRSANISERYINYLAIGKDPYEMLGNPDLKPEKNNQLDAEISYKTSQASVQLSLYYGIVSDYISSEIDPNLKPLLSAPGVRRYINIDKANLYGFESAYSQQLSKFFKQTASLSYNYGQNLSEDIALPEISPINFKYVLESSLLKNHLIPFSSLRHSFKQDRINSNFGEVKTDAFTIVDLGIKAMMLNNLQASVTVTNAFDTNYREHLSRFISAGNPLLAQGRSFVFNLTYGF